jgi:hypothetical protein
VEGDLKRTDLKPMKRRLVPVLIGISAMTLLTGCVVGFSFGSGKKESSNNSNTSNNTANTATTDQHPVQQTIAPTVGQQLLDLKKARDAGAITEQEYETEKAKILSAKQ